ncbi:uncharacterized protein LOC117583079 [Drosophila guanche]|uniref:Uncharacterized protein n=1 Tax=Drosophila guanche TaxID=7266 RepID=A0A3B0JIQ4_DROGU|nr:uncharacterized protein LOC117583079 [Drosophila guanche]SPP80202.1 Hypothetical predicted protein [Drosophila guanche]
MWQRVAVLVLGIYVLITMKAARGSTSSSSSNNRFNGGTSGGILAARAKGQLQLELNAWQPFRQRNNWLILQATAASSVQPESENTNRLLPQQQQQQQEQLQRLPVNYYAYNHRYNESVRQRAVSSPSAGGNYKQAEAEAQASDPASYVLAISQLPLAEAEAEPASSLTNSAHAADKLEDAADSDASKDTALAGIQAYLLPFQRTLLKVRNLCDSLGTLLGDVLEEEPLQLPADETRFTSKESSPRLALEGRKLKKLKKKFQKLLLPLLIAYKLKFLTLIPVLIGGLTLLVGTTGLAGFFFALFTAVMSLKTTGGGGHGSKAIVLKKI